MTRVIDADKETLIDVANVSTPNRRAVLEGIQGMSMEERGKLLDELIMTEQNTSSSF
jgi:hypothetical protein